MCNRLQKKQYIQYLAKAAMAIVLQLRVNIITIIWMRANLQLQRTKSDKHIYSRLNWAPLN